MRRAALVLVVAALLAAPADARIRLGDGIGGVRLGMTQAQVQRALGKPLGVERGRAAFGGETLTLHFGYAAYDVELRRVDGAMRVVRVATGLLKERTPEGIGVGSLETELTKAYPKVRCTAPEARRFRDGRIRGFGPRTCVLREGRAETQFLVRQQRRFNREEHWVSRTAEVFEVSVRAL